MSRRVLVVEDQEDNRRIVRDLLTSAGFEVLEATSGGEGVAMAERESPDLIIMDVQLPGMLHLAINMVTLWSLGQAAAGDA